MDGSKKRLFSWWNTSSYSTRLWGFMVPCMVLSGLLVLLGLNPNSSNWAWTSVFPAGRNFSSFKGFVPQPEVGGSGLELRQKVVAGGGGETEDPPPPLAVKVKQAEPPVGNKKYYNFVNTQNKSNATLPRNGTRLLPPASRPRINRKFSELQMLEAKLQQVRAAIKNALTGKGTYDSEYIPTGPIYWNPSAFHRSYLEMEKHFRVFVYEEGEHPIFHNGPCGSIYSMEGNFINKLEVSNFRTRDPEKASVYFLPFSVAFIVRFVYDKNSLNHWLPMKDIVKDYVDLVAAKYPYWNRSLGTDHLMLSCHDWGPELSKSLPELFKNSIRALCNANTTEGFQPSKDVSIPEINLPGGRATGLLGGPSPSRRPILAFFAGGLHGPIRPILLENWENKDPDVQVHKYLPKNVSYSKMMRKSRYCICPSGYEVASPRMVEALYTGCVPVLIKDHYVAPFSDVLNWRSFSVEILVSEIPNMKNILMGISSRQYIRMQRRGVRVRRHFEVNLVPRRYDVFHMALHSIWLRRLNIRVHGVEDS